MAPAKSAERRRYEPSAADREAVALMVGHGIPLDEIRRVVINPATGKAISKATLVKHFRGEIDAGLVKANARVAESLFMQAVGRARVVVDGEVVQEERPANTSAAIWWTKARMGWKASGETVSGQAKGRAVGEGRGPAAEDKGDASRGRVVVYLPDNNREDETQQVAPSEHGTKQGLQAEHRGDQAAVGTARELSC